jgi:hypothetical protein
MSIQRSIDVVILCDTPDLLLAKAIKNLSDYRFFLLEVYPVDEKFFGFVFLVGDKSLFRKVGTKRWLQFFSLSLGKTDRGV